MIPDEDLDAMEARAAMEIKESNFDKILLRYYHEDVPRLIAEVRQLREDDKQWRLKLKMFGIAWSNTAGERDALRAQLDKIRKAAEPITEQLKDDADTIIISKAEARALAEAIKEAP